MKMPERWAQTERSAAPEGEAGSGLPTCGYIQRCGRFKLGKMSSSGGGGASGARIAIGGARRRECGGSARGYYPGAYILLKGLKRHMRLGTLKCQWCPYPLNYS